MPLIWRRQTLLPLQLERERKSHLLNKNENGTAGTVGARNTYRPSLDIVPSETVAQDQNVRETTPVNLDSIGEALDVFTNCVPKTDPDVTIEQAACADSNQNISEEIGLTTFPEWLSGTEPFPHTPGAVRPSSLCL